MENMLENQSDQREVFILISLLFITLFQRARRARLILLQRLISRGIQRRRRAAFSQFLTFFAWRQQQRPKRVAWVLPRPQYWFETLFHSNALVYHGLLAAFRFVSFLVTSWGIGFGLEYPEYTGNAEAPYEGRVADELRAIQNSTGSGF